jgi:hypothetical protein
LLLWFHLIFVFGHWTECAVGSPDAFTGTPMCWPSWGRCFGRGGGPLCWIANCRGVWSDMIPSIYVGFRWGWFFGWNLFGNPPTGFSLVIVITLNKINKLQSLITTVNIVVYELLGEHYVEKWKKYLGH